MNRTNGDEMLKSEGFQFDDDLRRRISSSWIEPSPILSVESRVDLEKLDERILVWVEGEAKSSLVGEEELEERIRMGSRLERGDAE